MILLSCTHKPDDINYLDIDEIYRSDMSIEVNGKRMDGGTYVLENQPLHSFKAFISPDTEKFVVSSCDRYLVWDDPDPVVEFDYTQGSLTDEDICPIEIAAFSRSGRHAWAYIDFLSTENLGVSLTCNGEKKEWYGVSICQSKEFLTHTAKFSRSVFWIHSAGCAEPTTTDDIEFEIPSSSGKCFYLFENEEGFHRLTVIGYDDVLISN